MTVVGGREGFDEVESGLFGLPCLQHSPKDDPGTLWQPRETGEGVHEDERSPWDDRDVPHLDSDLLFGQPCLQGVVTDGPACAWQAHLDGGIGLPVRSTAGRKFGWDVAYLERVGMVGWPG